MAYQTNIEVFAKSGQWKWKILNAIDMIPEADLSKEKIESVLKNLDVKAEVIVDVFDDIAHIHYQINQEYDKCPNCKTGSMVFNRACGVEVCSNCSIHKGLSKCFCGWNVRDVIDAIEVGMFENAKLSDTVEWEVDY